MKFIYFLMLGLLLGPWSQLTANNDHGGPEHVPGNVVIVELDCGTDVCDVPCDDCLTPAAPEVIMASEPFNIVYDAATNGMNTQTIAIVPPAGTPDCCQVDVDFTINYTIDPSIPAGGISWTSEALFEIIDANGVVLAGGGPGLPGSANNGDPIMGSAPGSFSGMAGSFVGGLTLSIEDTYDDFAEDGTFFGTLDYTMTVQCDEIVPIAQVEVACDDGDICTVGEVETVFPCSTGDIICIPCAGVADCATSPDPVACGCINCPEIAPAITMQEVCSGADPDFAAIEAEVNAMGMNIGAFSYFMDPAFTEPYAPQMMMACGSRVATIYGRLMCSDPAAAGTPDEFDDFVFDITVHADVNTWTITEVAGDCTMPATVSILSENGTVCFEDTGAIPVFECPATVGSEPLDYSFDPGLGICNAVIAGSVAADCAEGCCADAGGFPAARLSNLQNGEETQPDKN